jgi:hypothetical protein
VLRPEPDNAWDPKAIQVLVQLAEVMPVAQVLTLAAALEGTGCDVHELMDAQAPLQLGYVEDSDGKAHQKRRANGFPGQGNAQVLELAQQHEWAGLRATLTFWADGQPCVKISAAGPG